MKTHENLEHMKTDGRTETIMITSRTDFSRYADCESDCTVRLRDWNKRGSRHTSNLFAAIFFNSMSLFALKRDAKRL
jgi:hypothetical protein